MRRPPEGLCLECEFLRMRDGDTVEIRVREGGLTWAIRLLDCWVPDHTDLDAKAKRFAETTLAATNPLHVWIPAPQDVNNLLKNLSFDRLLGHLFVESDLTLSELLVDAGFATHKKPTAKG